MSRYLPYHVGPDGRFSLDFVTADRSRYERRLTTRSAEDGITVETRTYDRGDGTDEPAVYAVYTNETVDSPLADLDRAEVEELIDEHFDGVEVVLLSIVVDAFAGVLDEWEQENDPLSLYKRLDLEKIAKALRRPGWNQEPVTTVAGQLLSNFVLAHPMPNANHRTALALTDRYLRAYVPEFSMPDTGEAGEWYSWAESFIHDSKRLLTVRRKTPLLRHVRRLGFDGVVRKGGVEIDCSQYELDREDRWGATTAIVTRSEASSSSPTY